ncbi:LacI family DNA-binding transcriptional regulator [Bifidobacterium pullorum]|uniref:LacI family DNA-binding transcriptional regulator n=1 Tax=Bifidobacterium pullorum TaxID=78448 RepID=UPI0024313C00|nr:LacI family DNA-binding transcriptional regulator [Bifidobacterium pullorum]
MARSTIQDVAKLAGVSEATVSRALRGLNNVAPATRHKVEEAAAELRFTLSKSASSLASGKTRRILLLVSGGLNDWFNSSVLQGAYEVFSPAGYDVTPSFITSRDELSRLIKALPSNRNADAIIVASFTLDQAFRDALAAMDMPLAGINNPNITGLDVSVRIDDLDGMRQAVQLLHSLGHRSLAYIGNLIPPDLDYSADLRGEGFLNAAHELGYAEDTLYLSPSDTAYQTLSPVETARRAVASLLAAPQHPTGVCVQNDELAAHILKELRRQHIRIPEQMSVIGFDDNPYADILDMTSIHQDPIQLAREASQRVLAILTGEQPDEPHLVVPTAPTLRGTTGVVRPM